MHHFDDEDLSWRTEYKSGDQYRSKVNDTYIPLYVGFVSDEFRATIHVEFDIKHKGQLLKCKYQVLKYDDKTLRVCWTFHERLAYFEDQKDVPLKKYMCNDVSYDDVVVLDSMNSRFVFKQIISIPWEYFAWSKSKGLIQYKYLTGETYSFYKILPEKWKRKKKVNSTSSGYYLTALGTVEHECINNMFHKLQP